MMLAGAPAVDAAILCQKRTGALFVRETCRKRETAVDPTALGLVGPKGDPGSAGEARAFGCSTASGDGSLVGACEGRPSKNIVAVVASSINDGATCFILDPSIAADTAVALASFSDAFFTSAVNVIISVFPAATFPGCPPNSVVVTTGRYRQNPSSTGMDLEIIRLGVNVAVM
jgi:hypothetical protein